MHRCCWNQCSFLIYLRMLVDSSLLYLRSTGRIHVENDEVIECRQRITLTIEDYARSLLTGQSAGFNACSYTEPLEVQHTLISARLSGRMVSMNGLHELVEAAFCGRKKSLQILVENNGNEPRLERLKLISMSRANSLRSISLNFGNFCLQNHS